MTLFFGDTLQYTITKIRLGANYRGFSSTGTGHFFLLRLVVWFLFFLNLFHLPLPFLPNIVDRFESVYGLAAF